MYMYIGLGFPGTRILESIYFPYFPKVWKAYSFQNCGTRKAQSYIHIYMYMYIGLGFPGTRILESICFPYFPKVWKAYSFQGKYVKKPHTLHSFGKYILTESIESIFFPWKVCKETSYFPFFRKVYNYRKYRKHILSKESM